jgi:hypothetical protein
MLDKKDEKKADNVVSVSVRREMEKPRTTQSSTGRSQAACVGRLKVLFFLFKSSSNGLKIDQSSSVGTIGKFASE